MAVGYRGGLITGKIGGDVGYMVKNAKGRTSQGWRAYQAQVANPNNYAQRYNRVILSTVAKAYSTLRPISDHAFEGVAGPSRNQKEFAKLNIRVMQNKAQIDEGNFNPRSNFDMLCNEYVVSKGSLPSLGDAYDESDNILTCVLPAILPKVNPSMREFFDIMGWQDQGQITLCICLGSASGANVSKFVYSRFVFKLGGHDIDDNVIKAEDSLFYDMTEGGQTVTHMRYDAIESVNVSAITTPAMADLKKAAIDFTLTSDYRGNLPVQAIACINSALIGNAWKRSTQSLDNIAGDDAAFTLDEAIASYSTVQNSSKFLNG